MDDIDLVRAFNRDWTRAMGLLGRNYLGTGLGVAEVRAVFELAQGRVATARELAATLCLDEGHVSRILGLFERRGWLCRRTDGRDRRRREIDLTDAGRAAIAALEVSSRADVAHRLAGLPEVRRRAILDAARASRPILAAEVTLHDLGPGDGGWIISRHAELYAQDEGYDQSFEALVAGIVAEFLRTRDPICDRAWIARRGDERLGSVFCVREDEDTARLRLFLLDPRARGIGLGRRMLSACLSHARERGFRRMVLWTHQSHGAACALYASAGFRMTAEAPARAFGCDVVDQTWELDLGPE
ncbi:bifunctional helix-turn-helix transcriptional regulator/GNAT family N-acetyltransferase [Albidovulum sediminis]|uniref:bifunctional helix-turn-helix transcriptional regulator/GNAT family N-acetyltransferase n=1 Tax=Albidovulum sediminis TaxID=3066345 RepID=UPI0034E2E8A8